MQFSFSSRFGKLSIYRYEHSANNKRKLLARTADGAGACVLHFAAAEPGEEGDPALSSVENT